MKYITFCPHCDDEGVPSNAHPVSHADELCRKCNRYLHTRTPETRHMKKPALMVKCSKDSDWQQLFNYNPRDAVPAYIDYVDKHYPGKMGTNFKIVDLEAHMASMVWVKCEYCNTDIHVREADRKRGWGRFCDKSCKAAHQSFGPKYPLAAGTVKLKPIKPAKPKKAKKAGAAPQPRESMKNTPKPENYGDFS